MFILHRVAFVLSTLAALALLISYAAPYVSPVYFSPIAFFGLAYPYLLLVNVLFVIYWLCFMKLKFIFPLLAILAGYTHVGHYFNFSPRRSVKPNDYIKVVTFNAHHFKYNKSTKNTKEFYAYLEKEQPDIICIQEFWDSSKTEKECFSKILKVLKAKEYHFTGQLNSKLSNTGGLLTISRFPIVNRGSVDLGPKTYNRCMYTDIDIRGEVTRVYNVHLQSIKFGKDAYHFVKQSEAETDSTMKQTRNIFRKLRSAFEMRAPQSEAVQESMEACKFRKLVCGDFNDTPVSYVYRTLSREMKDAFAESGSGYTYSYTGPFPSFRIDYILLDKDFDGYDYETGSSFFSDHRVIKTLVKVK
jgi:endonuclease/exonuclease/phosphatase family metal-dependent hydrolase